MVKCVPSVWFEAKLSKIGSWTILRVPKEASMRLPSRDVTVVEGTINGSGFKTVLEPDGRGSHWFRVDEKLLRAAGADPGGNVTLEFEPTDEWPDPKLPEDFRKALAGDPQAHALWMDITPNARWDWTRWIGATKQPETRRRRIEVALSKLDSGSRRPCCFNRNRCAEPYVSNNGKLLEPVQVSQRHKKK